MSQKIPGHFTKYSWFWTGVKRKIIPLPFFNLLMEVLNEYGKKSTELTILVGRESSKFTLNWGIGLKSGVSP